MSITLFLEWFGYFIYACMAVAALFGVYCTFLLLRRIKQKQFSSEADAQDFLEDLGNDVKARKYDSASELCDSPDYWSKAVPQLAMVAIQNRERSPNKLRKLLGEKFNRDILADLEYGTSWIGTVAKSAPMLGLLGTVTGMIAAFGKIEQQSASGSLDPGALAGDISFALFTTAAGLLIALPLILAGNMVNVQIGKLQDSVQDHLGLVLEDLDEATGAA
ncbi:MAG: MotA/TolQ/ExbB proton channel family protein [Planctomycetaceae bacterium]